MIAKLKHSKHTPYTDDEIKQYCESVENLLMKIKEDSLTKKRKKRREMAMEVETEVEEEAYIKEEEDDFVLS